jgi:hypothetical protein
MFFHFHFLNGQNATWRLLNKIEVSDCQSWDVDPMGQIIFSSNDVLVKLDTNFQVQFQESAKNFGIITSVDARHSLKTLVFSEEQQVVAFLDNTLASHKGAQDLTEYDVSFATHVSYSGQSTRYWIFDGDNSKLVLVDETKNRPQVLENLAGIIGSFQVHQLLEIENILFLFDKTKGIYLFDIYGSLIDLFETNEARQIYFFDGNLFYITTNQLVKWNIKTREKESIELPEKNCLEFRVLGNYFFFRTDSYLKKYVLF